MMNGSLRSVKRTFTFSEYGGTINNIMIKNAVHTAFHYVKIFA